MCKYFHFDFVTFCHGWLNCEFYFKFKKIEVFKSQQVFKNEQSEPLTYDQEEDGTNYGEVFFDFDCLYYYLLNKIFNIL